MSRIRSIHPGIWTDEGFMSVSAHARLLLIGLWTEAFDDGMFEWKALTLKARIFPVDNVDINELLQELTMAGFIRRVETHAKKPGVIRNFQKFQRPKKPNSSGMLTDDLLDFVGAKSVCVDPDDDSSEPVRNQFGTGAEKSPQMEDGGDKGSSLRSEEKKERERDLDSDFQEWFSSWPSYASDDEAAAWRAWASLTQEDLHLAAKNTAAYLVASRGGGRTAVCSADKYLSRKLWLRVKAQAPPKPKIAALEAITSASKHATKEAYLAAELARSERSFQR